KISDIASLTTSFLVSWMIHRQARCDNICDCKLKNVSVVKQPDRRIGMTQSKPRVNPLSRQPRQQRLVIAVRGGAGVGKTYFAASMADAGLGRLCIIDTERKTRLLKGVGTKFDGLEIEHPSEVPEFVEWLVASPEAAAQNYGCYALDSW